MGVGLSTEKPRSLSLSCHLLHSICGTLRRIQVSRDSRMFWVCPKASPGKKCPEYLTKEMPRRLPNQTPKSPYHGPLSSSQMAKLLTLSLSETPPFSLEETHFHHLYLLTYSFNHYPELETIAEGMDMNKQVRQLRYNVHITVHMAPICLSISCSPLP